jgi:hypothetical protein
VKQCPRPSRNPPQEAKLAKERLKQQQMEEVNRKRSEEREAAKRKAQEQEEKRKEVGAGVTVLVKNTCSETLRTRFITTSTRLKKEV